MSFDTWTIASLVDELDGTLVGGRVQQVVQVDEDTLALEIYAGGERHYLLASANRQHPRLHRIRQKPRRGVDAPSPMLQLLRKFVRGGVLVDAYQPAWERVLFLEFRHPEAGITLLAAELIGRWANLLLLRPVGDDLGVDRFRILECVHRVRSEDPAARDVMPGKLYEPPPAQRGLPPDSLTELRLRAVLEGTEPAMPLWRALVDELLGFSPLLAREVAFRATGDARIRVAEVERVQPLLAAVIELVDLKRAGEWQPGTIVDEVGDATAFAAFPLRHRIEGGARWHAAPSVSAAAERFYAFRTAAGEDSYAAARAQVAGQLGRARRKLVGKQEALVRELRSPEEIEQLRVAGEWILALATQIAPRQETLDLSDAGVEGMGPIHLDPALSPADNAAAYFKRYHKAKRAGQAADRRLAEVAAELAYLEQLGADLALAANRNEIDAVQAALAAAGYGRKAGPGSPRGSDAAGGPRRFTSEEGYAILVGRNSRENERVTFGLAAADDLWLHARDRAGSHVVVRSGGRPVSENTVRRAAELAAYYSGARGDAWVDVMVVERRHVRRAPGKRPGMVTVDGERVVRVRPQAPGD